MEVLPNEKIIKNVFKTKDAYTFYFYFQETYRKVRIQIPGMVRKGKEIPIDAELFLQRVKKHTSTVFKTPMENQVLIIVPKQKAEKKSYLVSLHSYKSSSWITQFDLKTFARTSTSSLL